MAMLFKIISNVYLITIVFILLLDYKVYNLNLTTYYECMNPK